MKKQFFNYDSLYNIIQNYIPQLNPFKSALKLKDFIGIGQNDPVEVKHIEQIENKLKDVGINVVGECEYKSKLNKLMNLNLIFEKNHFFLNHDINKKVNYESSKERKLMLVIKTDKQWIGYAGEETINLNTELYDNILKFKTDYITFYIDKATPENMKEKYNKYIDIANALKEKTNGEINYYKTGSERRTALKIFDMLTKHISPEVIEYDECVNLQSSMRGALQFCEVNYEGIGYKSDIVSQYPSIMKSTNSLVPVCRGVFKKILIEDFDKMKNSYFAYGLYNVKVTKSDNEKINRLFRFNEKNKLYKSNWYNSIDLKIAQLLKLEFHLLDEEDHNCVLYPRNKCLTGQQVFGRYVDKLYNLKKDKVDGAKTLLNKLNGLLFETNKTVIEIDEDDIMGEDINLDKEGYKIISKSTNENNISKCKLIDKEYFFKSRFARYYPFLISKARLQMVEIILSKGIDKVVKVKTDGIISTIPLEYSEELGGLKYEGYYENIKIYNNSKIEAKYIKDYMPPKLPK